MLKNIPSILSPDLLYVLQSMGHGDEIVFADGNFPADSNAQRIVRLDGHGMSDLLAAGESALYANLILKKGVVS